MLAAAPGALQVRPDAATAQRSNASGRLQLTMPKEDPSNRNLDFAHMRYVHIYGTLG